MFVWKTQLVLRKIYLGFVCLQVTGVMTQGRGDGVEWVTSFMVSYSMDAFHWQYVSDQYGNQRVSRSTSVHSAEHWVVVVHKSDDGLVIYIWFSVAKVIEGKMRTENFRNNSYKKMGIFSQSTPMLVLQRHPLHTFVVLTFGFECKEYKTSKVLWTENYTITKIKNDEIDSWWETW